MSDRQKRDIFFGRIIQLFNLQVNCHIISPRSTQSGFISLSRGVKGFCENQREGILALKRDVVALKDSNRVQLVTIKSCLDEVMSTVSALTEQMSTNEVKTRTNLIDIDKKIGELINDIYSQATRLFCFGLEKTIPLSA